MYKRFILRKTDKDPLKRAEKHDEIYSGLDEIFRSEFSRSVSVNAKIDTKFFLSEIADNFLIHDDRFEKANLDIWVNRTTLDVTIKVMHNGREFDPLSSTSRCENIRAAAERLKMKPPTQDPYSHLEEKFGLSYNLDSVSSEEEVQS